jgi:phage tail-like protein
VKADEIAGLLPAVFRQALGTDATLRALLEVMEAMQDPVEVQLGRLHQVFDALATDDRFAPMLARWVDLDWLYGGDDADDPGAAAQAWLDSGMPLGRLRLLIHASHTLAQERGTAHGLVRFLEIATGVRGFRVDDANQGARPFHLYVHVPAAAAEQIVLVHRIVDAEKPAYTTWEPVLDPAAAAAP